MWGAVIGDIAGSRFEGSRGGPKGFELFHRRCMYTDDTVCTATIAFIIVNNRKPDSTLRTGAGSTPTEATEGRSASGSRGQSAPTDRRRVGMKTTGPQSLRHSPGRRASKKVSALQAPGDSVTGLLRGAGTEHMARATRT